MNFLFKFIYRWLWKVDIISYYISGKIIGQTARKDQLQIKKNWPLWFIYYLFIFSIFFSILEHMCFLSLLLFTSHIFHILSNFLGLYNTLVHWCQLFNIQMIPPSVLGWWTSNLLQTEPWWLSRLERYIH